MLVNDENNLSVLQELNRIAFVHEYTLIQAWSSIECARHIETFKAYEAKWVQAKLHWVQAKWVQAKWDQAKWVQAKWEVTS